MLAQQQVWDERMNTPQPNIHETGDLRSGEKRPFNSVLDWHCEFLPPVSARAPPSQQRRLHIPQDTQTHPRECGVMILDCKSRLRMQLERQSTPPQLSNPGSPWERAFIT